MIKRALLLALLVPAALLAALGLGVLRFSRAPALAFEPPPALAASPAAEASSVTLSYVELAASPHRTENPGATQVYGWLVRADDGQPVSGGMIRLRFLDYASAAESAAEAHAQATSGDRPPAGTYRDIEVQDDGGWYANLPGKCWLESAEFSPHLDRTYQDKWARDNEGNWSGAFIVHVPPPGVGPPPLIRTSIPLEAPLERGAVEITFRASSGVEALGVVFDAQTAEPVPGARVILRSLRNGQLEGGTDARGAFRLRGIDPQELQPVNGMLQFLVAASGYENVEREVAWESGQNALPSFRVVLAPHVSEVR